MVTQSLQDFVATTVEWMAQYQFDPWAVELGFGLEHKGPLPAWTIDLRSGRKLALRGAIDRVDLLPFSGEDAAMAVVIDYKSSATKLDSLKLEHGLQLQLPAYLSVLRHLGDPRKEFGFGRLIEGGVFYVNLRGESDNGSTRREVIQNKEASRQKRYQHLGRFDVKMLRHLDSRGEKEGTQFKYKLKKDRTPDARNTDLLSSSAFAELLDHVESELVRMGNEIYGGNIDLNPFQKGKETACKFCKFKGICRFDPWEDSYRILRSKKAEPELD
jgi:ATP-dependent helicase/nuclease subunit B